MNSVSLNSDEILYIQEYDSPSQHNLPGDFQYVANTWGAFFYQILPESSFFEAQSACKNGTSLLNPKSGSFKYQHIS